MVVSVPLNTAFTSVGVILLNSIPFSLGWNLIARRRVTAIEAIAIGISLSTAGIVLINLCSVAWAQTPWAWWIFPLSTFLIMLVFKSQLRESPAPVGSPKEAWAAGIAVTLMLLVHIKDIQRLPLGSGTRFDLIHPDVYVFESMANAIAQFGPNESGVMSGVGYRYHWFTYAWSGWLTHEVGASPLVVMLRVLPIIVALALAGLAASIASRLMRGSWVPLLVATALLVGTSFDYFSGSVINWTSPSHSLGALWLLGLVFICVEGVTSRLSIGLVLFVALLSIATMGGKVSHGVLAVAGLSMIVLVSLLTYRSWSRRSIILWIVVLVSSASTFILVESGQPGGGSLTSSGASSALDGGTAGSALYGVAVALAALVFARVVRGLGLGYALVDPDSRQWPITWWAVGSTLGAFVLVSLFRSTSGTDQWFMESAAVTFSIVAALGVSKFLQKASSAYSRQVYFRRVGGAVLLALVLSVAATRLFELASSSGRVYLSGVTALTLIILVSLVLAYERHKSGLKFRLLGWAGVIGLTVSIALPIVTGPVSLLGTEETDEPVVVTYSWAEDRLLKEAKTDPYVLNDGAAVAAWIREHTSPETIVASLDPTTAWFSALSGRRLFASFPEQIRAWSLQEDASVYESRRALVNDLSSSQAAAGALAQICSTRVEWIWGKLDSPASRSLGEPVFSAGSEALWPTCRR